MRTKSPRLSLPQRRVLRALRDDVPPPKGVKGQGWRISTYALERRGFIKLVYPGEIVDFIGVVTRSGFVLTDEGKRALTYYDERKRKSDENRKKVAQANAQLLRAQLEGKVP